MSTVKIVATNSQRLNTLLTESYEEVLDAKSMAASFLHDVVGNIESTMKRLNAMLTGNILKIDEDVNRAISLKFTTLEQAVNSLIQVSRCVIKSLPTVIVCFSVLRVTGVSDAQNKASALAKSNPVERTKSIKQAVLAVTYAIKQLVQELTEQKLASESANVLNLDTDEASVIVDIPEKVRPSTAFARPHISLMP